MPLNRDSLKKQAAHTAANEVESGMVIGLGHGSTALFAVQRIAERIKIGDLKNILAIPCSLFIESEARQLGIPLTTLDENPTIDLTIDGADEVSKQLDLIKGGGGALLREKIVAQASEREIIIIDDSKLSRHLGKKWAVPVEVVPFGWKSAHEFLTLLGADVKIRKAGDGVDFRTDQGNMILDANFGPIAAPGKLAEKLDTRAAIVAHGLFVGIATEVIVADEEGVRILKRTIG